MISIRRDGALLLLTGEVPADPADGDSYVEALGRVSTQKEPFVLLVDIGIEIKLSQPQRKAQNLWYKADRGRIEAKCRACALVRTAADETMQRAWQGLFRFPVLVTCSREEAQEFLAPYAGEIVCHGEVAAAKPVEADR